MKQESYKKEMLLIDEKKYQIFGLKGFAQKNNINLNRLPFSIKILLENSIRNLEMNKNSIVKKEDVIQIANWKPKYESEVEIPYFPSRVVMQDFTGVPAVVDLAAMRDAVKQAGKDSNSINPSIPVDLIIDHSVQIDYYGTPSALQKNMDLEFKRNKERYALLKWAQNSFENFNIFPPGVGIIHQVNLEYLSKVVATKSVDNELFAFPDSLIGTDSHTTMIDGMGIMGWGVGGIEAEAVMLGQPLYMKIPEVVGVKLVGKLKPGVTPTDLVLTIVELLRKENVVEKFVEFYGEGMKKLSLPDRAMIANMAPEYGATMGFFPVDEKVLEYLQLTGREELVPLVESYTKEQTMFYFGDEEPEYSKYLQLDLSEVEPSMAGPSRPQDKIELKNLDKEFSKLLAEKKVTQNRKFEINLDGEKTILSDGSIVMASITSCTNTSNPYVLVGAGLLAKKAVEKGMKVPSFVKTSFAPGSRTVEEYLKKGDLLPYLEELGFNIVGFGCATCIGNSGPLHQEIEKTIKENNLISAAVLSGNRNFEARIHQQVKANYLASPILVVAFALAGNININPEKDPLGFDKNNNPVYLKDLWPTSEEIYSIINSTINPELFKQKYANVLEGNENWRSLPVAKSSNFKWEEKSTYVRQVPFFNDFMNNSSKLRDIQNARVLLMLGDTVTTDHISPAGAIPEEYPAGKYLINNGVKKEDFNTYGSRRGNHEVMMRGTFANIRIRNRLVAPKEGGLTKKLPENIEMFVFDAAEKYSSQQQDLIIIAGKEYGTGSSRDWAAKGTKLLGVKAVIAESYERIHRSNLIGMGVLPLEFANAESAETLGLDGTEIYSIMGISDITPTKTLFVIALKENLEKIKFEVKARLDTEIEVEYYKNDGILTHFLKQMC